eukprot:COSAG03_NODE_27133_length_255_cov_0.647436_1_plen_53_part_10
MRGGRGRQKRFPRKSVAPVTTGRGQSRERKNGTLGAAELRMLRALLVVVVWSR